MKMSEFFNLPVSDDFVSKMDHSQCVKFVSDGVAEFDAAVYAINNHDRLEQENAELRAEVIKLRSGLLMIENPISYLQEQAEREGNDFNAMAAINLSNDPEWLKGIAKQLLNK